LQHSSARSAIPEIGPCSCSCLDAGYGSRGSTTTVDAIEYRSRQLYVLNGKGSKDRVVYLSEDAQTALAEYIKKRRWSKQKRVFLVQKGPFKGTPISVRGIQRESNTMQEGRDRGILSSFKTYHGNSVVNADADLVTIQDLLATAKYDKPSAIAEFLILSAERLL